ncbi:unnamed protein product [Callosobruchus maculatus]|uniref:Uncharacterized protein n=1 Tax=Callosobruchus maculatus TaxID=64391 RepID=A0A653DAH8_CALMS|nr:unnamed protein product [Callosobruchus maculatus]
MMRSCVTKNASLSVNPICACNLVIPENDYWGLLNITLCHCQKWLTRTRMMRPCITKNSSLSVNPTRACNLVISENDY